jgi:hypothetical protein
MKKYSQEITRLYEAIGFEKIESGKTYTTSKGGKLYIKSIYIDATNETAEVYVNYNFEDVNGEKKEETNRFNEVVDLIRTL